MAGDQAGVFEVWYKKLDTSGSGSIQAGPAAGFLKKSGLNDNVLSRVSLKRWWMTAVKCFILCADGCISHICLFSLKHTTLNLLDKLRLDVLIEFIFTLFCKLESSNIMYHKYFHNVNS